jgi:hypothetical protein
VSGPVLSLRCGMWNAHEECRSKVCECPCHGRLPLDLSSSDPERVTDGYGKG